MKPTHGRRTWVKLWVRDWLDGTTRYQMSDAQRAFWTDLLAMAGDARIGGVICSGKDPGEKLIGYPLRKFEALMSDPGFDVLETFDLFARTGKISIEVSDDSPKLYVVHILNWQRYQSEYERAKQYRGQSRSQGTEKVQQKSQAESQQKSQPMSRESSMTEVEGEGEGEGEERKKQGAKTAPVFLPDDIPVDLWNAFVDMRAKMRRPVTPKGATLLLKKLDDLKKQGCSLKMVLETSVRRGWSDFFPPANGANKTKLTGDALTMANLRTAFPEWFTTPEPEKEKS
jgi:hypothetical protein